MGVLAVVAKEGASQEVKLWDISSAEQFYIITTYVVCGYECLSFRPLKLPDPCSGVVAVQAVSRIVRAHTIFLVPPSGECSQAKENLLPREAVQKTHAPQGDPVQEGQGEQCTSGSEALRQETERVRRTD
eukprot:GHVU01226064.1.p1 GENE.GHVU01226064.1~~GHVU01226064.1.p1  ORF type:complete len:130 (+),score=6.80 GHVU01226064.1:1121-1510(+)